MNRLKSISRKKSNLISVPKRNNESDSESDAEDTNQFQEDTKSAVFDANSNGLSADTLIEDLDFKLQRGSMKRKAVNVLSNTLDALAANIHDIDRPATLSKIATDMSKIVYNLDEDARSAQNNPQSQQVIIYRPIMQTENHFDSINLQE
jgi:hypothetical protein